MTNDTFQTEVLTQLGDIKAICASNHTATEDLKDRVYDLEEHNKTQDRRRWVHSLVVLALSQLHALRGWIRL